MPVQSPIDLQRTVRAVRTAVSEARLHAGVSVVALEIPAADTAGYPARALLPLVDFLVVDLYDEHDASGGPGPIATARWVRRNLAARVAEVGPSRLVAALPTFGYVWRPNQQAQMVRYVDARRLASQANVELVRDPASNSLHATQPGSWDLWLCDAELLRSLRAEVLSFGVTRIALWRVGYEDPAIWTFMSR